MEIIIEGPSFYDEEDENIFFNALYALPGFLSVKGKGLNLHIQFKSSPSDEAVKQLVVICRRWFIDIAPLLPLKNQNNSGLVLWHEPAS
ncbi:hypothetical protein [Simiduia aestuariiviva]|nr:hypothetical protein [Simiduia aestuariiviva]